MKYALLIILSTLFLFIFIYEFLIPAFELYNKNRKIIKKYGKRKKKQCINCKYCIWALYHPFYKYGINRNLLVHKIPRYCKKAKKELRQEIFLRCEITDLEFAEFEEKE